MTTESPQFAERIDGQLRRYEYDDAITYAADVGPREASVDVVGETAIVVLDGEQFEIELPTGDATTAVTNGVLTIEVER
ncbi:hypothetical protein BRC90_00290 [Halobacteriales archaeon QS_4_69_34]|nr:MAG: hypothetical protein BRC90_00290 [Halobacteriales archaeon QS_4_69_34]